MNEEQMGRMSQHIADAPVPDSVQVRLRQARQAAVARSQSSTATHGGVLALALRHPKWLLLSMALCVLLGLTLLQQQQKRDVAAIDIALLSSDVPMELLLDEAMLEADKP